MKSDFTDENGLILPNADFKQVANDIVNNMESWRVDSQAKTEATLTKLVANMNKKANERATANGSNNDSSNRGYGQGRKMGD